MSRQLKRVALDFEWPLKKVWNGFLNPFYEFQVDCEACGGSGYSSQANLFNDQWWGKAPFDPVAYGSKIIPWNHPYVLGFATNQIEREPEFYLYGRGFQTWEKDRAIRVECFRLIGHWNQQWAHHPNQADLEVMQAKEDDRFKLKGKTLEEAQTASFNNYDSNRQWILLKARCAREGAEVGCSVCGGNGSFWPSPELEKQYDDWEKIEPPAGEGYQIWETVSEGSPVSPVFASPADLADWMVENDDSVTADTTRDEWLAFINGPGWAPSGLGISGAFMSGVKGMSQIERKD